MDENDPRLREIRKLLRENKRKWISTVGYFDENGKLVIVREGRYESTTTDSTAHDDGTV